MKDKSKPKRKEGVVFIGAWVPEATLAALDVAVTRLDLDRSKFLRRALEEKMILQNETTFEK